jgi:hypothetical protein
VPHNLRVSSLDELNDGGRKSDGKTVVELTFQCKKDKLTTIIGSSIIDKQRLYFVSLKKVTKRM